MASQAVLSPPTIELQLTVPTVYEQAVQKAGYVKVLLWFETEKPMMQASRALKGPPFSLEGPVLEFVAVLKRAEQTYDLIWAFLEDFETLKSWGAVPPDGRLGSFEFIEEDRGYLAWVV